MIFDEEVNCLWEVVEGAYCRTVDCVLLAALGLGKLRWSVVDVKDCASVHVLINGVTNSECWRQRVIPSLALRMQAVNRG